ncbi:MAG: aminotransferase class V-fold PLP-dependent enzyme [Alphaproteobacteria bacterium]|nr:aminotransferase class V-fold PLP-dependent enzyme [Alphaproteobacteria bacterium]
MPINVKKARDETPGATNVLHFNNAGASLMPTPVLKKVMNHLRLESEIGGYEAADKCAEAIENVYKSISKLLNCNTKEVAVIENATRAWDMAFYSIPFQKGDRILTAQAEYASNYISYLQVSKRTGVEVEVVPNDECGQISIEVLEKAIDKHVKLIAITHVPTNGGLVNPAKKVGEIAKARNILYLLDACQSVGQMPIDVQEIGCDMLSATGRKYLRGPRGTGFLYVRENLLNLLETPFLDLHAARWTSINKYEIRPDARRFENWECNIAAKLGLGRAVEYAMEWKLDHIYARIQHLAADLRKKLKNIKNVTVMDLGKEQCGIITFMITGQDPVTTQRSLHEKKINISVSIAEYSRLDMDARGIDALLRASVHYYNTEEEVERFCEAIEILS